MGGGGSGGGPVPSIWILLSDGSASATREAQVRTDIPCTCTPALLIYVCVFRCMSRASPGLACFASSSESLLVLLSLMSFCSAPIKQIQEINSQWRLPLSAFALSLSLDASLSLVRSLVLSLSICSIIPLFVSPFVYLCVCCFELWLLVGL